MRKYTALICILLLALLLPHPAVRAEALDPERPCSMELRYASEGEGFPGLEIAICRVARANPDGTFDLVAPWDGFGANIHGITAQSEWRTAASTLRAGYVSGQLTPDRTAVTDEEGKVVFSELETGLYLILGVRAENDKGIWEFEDFLLYLPSPGEDGYRYDIQALPKCSLRTPKTAYSVVKLWRDYGTDRPEGVTVDIYKDGVLENSVLLNSENDWSYSWTTPEDGSVWTVAEREVPAGYYVTVEEKDGAFIVTNTKLNPPPDIPQTGDTFPVLFWVMTMCLSGALILCLSIWMKRRDR